MNPHGSSMTGAWTVSGGTLRVEGTSGVSSGAMTVKNGATLDIASGATLSSSAVTLETGSTLALTATNSTFTALTNAVTLPTGENEKAKIRIDGHRLTCGNHTILSNVTGSADHVEVDLSGTALDGRKRVSFSVDGTNLVLTINPNGTVIFVR